MANILDESKLLQEEIVAHRRHIHQNAELSMDLPLTTAYVSQQLEKMGYSPQLICKSGIVAIAGGKKPGKVILLRADMDALPITEDTDEPFKSTNGAMHACGHDTHTAMLLGAAKLLKNHEDEIEGTVKLMFQPAEETLLGAKTMVEAGILENPKVDMTMMIHVATGMPIPAGLILTPSPGALSATSDGFKIRIQGKGGHGAMPNMAIDPLIPASTIHLGLQSIISREMAASDSVVVTVGKYTGGHAPNIIPDFAQLEGTIRTFDNNHRDFAKKRITEIVEGIASSFRCTAETTFFNGCPSVTISEEGASDFEQIMKETFSLQSVLPMSKINPGGKVMGSEDFAFVTEKVPGIMAVLTAGDVKEGYLYTQHHPKARFKEDVLFKGSAAYAAFALEWLKKHNN